MTAKTSVGSQMFEALERRQLLSAGPFDDGGPAVVHETNLVTNGGPNSAPAKFPDGNLLNPWGLASSAGGPFWISDNNAGVTTIYTGDGVAQGSPIGIPGATGSPVGAPTGDVFAGGDGFTVSAKGKSGPALFIFVSEDGGISGWSNKVDPNNAVIAVDNGNADPNLNAVYKGVTIGDVGSSHFLYATNFRAGTIEVYNTSFKPAQMPGRFSDPKVPAGFAPFNIQNLDGKLYVTYAKQNATKHDDVAGRGNGFVAVFDTQGHLLEHFHHGGFLNSPWGLAEAPASWGRLAGDILVGQFGSGLVGIFNQKGEFRGFLHDDTGDRLHIDRLWGLRFGNDGLAGPSDTLFFTAGTNDEADGLFGSLTLQRRPDDDGLARLLDHLRARK